MKGGGEWRMGGEGKRGRRMGGEGRREREDGR